MSSKNKKAVDASILQKIFHAKSRIEGDGFVMHTKEDLSWTNARVFYHDHEIKTLIAREKQILALLISQTGHIISITHLADLYEGTSFSKIDKGIDLYDVYINRIKRKIKAEAPDLPAPDIRKNTATEPDKSKIGYCLYDRTFEAKAPTFPDLTSVFNAERVLNYGPFKMICPADKEWGEARLYIADNPVLLTPKENKIVALLISQQGGMVTGEDVKHRVEGIKLTRGNYTLNYRSDIVRIKIAFDRIVGETIWSNAITEVRPEKGVGTTPDSRVAYHLSLKIV